MAPNSVFARELGSFRYGLSERQRRGRPVAKAFGRFHVGFLKRLCLSISLTAWLAGTAFPQQALTWQQVKDKFESANPSLRAGQSVIVLAGPTGAETFIRHGWLQLAAGCWR